mmetsp:Transcript_18013/g.35308  ORF Transcript_18013/g.35308 Transcript_18013/m.35308 type:complete len:356 (+) Transcript_18013:337-1404(+)
MSHVTIPAAIQQGVYVLAWQRAGHSMVPIKIAISKFTGKQVYGLHGHPIRNAAELWSPPFAAWTAAAFTITATATAASCVAPAASIRPAAVPPLLAAPSTRPAATTLAALFRRASEGLICGPVHVGITASLLLHQVMDALQSMSNVVGRRCYACCLVTIKSFAVHRDFGACPVSEGVYVCTFGSNEFARHQCWHCKVKRILASLLSQKWRVRLALPVGNLHQVGNNGLKGPHDLVWFIAVQDEHPEWRRWVDLVALADPDAATSVLFKLRTGGALGTDDVGRQWVCAEDFESEAPHITQPCCSLAATRPSLSTSFFALAAAIFVTFVAALSPRTTHIFFTVMLRFKLPFHCSQEI